MDPKQGKIDYHAQREKLHTTPCFPSRLRSRKRSLLTPHISGQFLNEQSHISKVLIKTGLLVLWKVNGAVDLYFMLV